jgi:prepilin-type N-terminal cleavage/methylation domain-containing protein
VVKYPIIKIQKMEQKHNAFSLIELSIVLIIMGLLIAGVSGGTKLIESAKMQRTIREIRNIRTAVNMFYERNGKLPTLYDTTVGPWGYNNAPAGPGPKECGHNNGKYEDDTTMGWQGIYSKPDPEHQYLINDEYLDKVSSVILFENLVKQGFYKLNPSTTFDGTKSTNTYPALGYFTDKIDGKVPSLWIPNMPRGEIGGVRGSGVILGNVIYYGGDGLETGHPNNLTWKGNHFMKKADYGHYFNVRPFVRDKNNPNDFPPNTVNLLDGKMDDGACDTGDIIVCIGDNCSNSNCNGYADGTSKMSRFILRFFSYLY